ncbi:50S ribosomal protein L6 [Spiroplasma endosymbiont of Anurida maritima]|uniref:50S ribosomal protein L6 n=1 Tax=Spiroplasma endosymbiont of Anurida maritima TaxID=2967972 RepID=UPI0036D3FF27
MSRIGNRELIIPAGVTANVENNKIITIKGPKGELSQSLPSVISVTVEENNIKTIRKNEIKHTKQLHGTINSLIKGMIEGVTNGYKKELEIIGVGYRAAMQGTNLSLNVGYSHPVLFTPPQGVVITVPKTTSVVVEGISKQLVGQVAADIRSYRKPEPYKGKGIRYAGERVIRKEGKSAGK